MREAPRPRKHKDRLTLFSGVFFWLGAGCGAASLLGTWLQTRSLPPGVCPLDTYRPLSVIAFVLLALSLALDLAGSRLRKKRRLTASGPNDATDREAALPEPPQD